MKPFRCFKYWRHLATQSVSATDRISSRSRVGIFAFPIFIPPQSGRCLAPTAIPENKEAPTPTPAQAGAAALEKIKLVLLLCDQRELFGIHAIRRVKSALIFARRRALPRAQPSVFQP
jgi:hypothetical protein